MDGKGIKSQLNEKGSLSGKVTKSMFLFRDEAFPEIGLSHS
jgi:hypothetical protein